MEEDRGSTGKDSKLREKAETKLEIQQKTTKDTPDFSYQEKDRLIHELQVHQIELEVQNEELRKTQQDLEAARDRYLDLYDFAPVGYLTISEKGKVLEANLTITSMLGVERSLMIGQYFSHFIDEDSQDLYYHHRKQIVKTREIETCELKLNKKDDTQFYARLECILIEDVHGEIAPHIRTVISDISKEKLAKEALKESEEKYRSMMTAMKDPVYICSYDYRIEYMNPAMIRSLGRDATGEKCFKAIHDLNEICTWCLHSKTSQKKCFENTIISPRNNRHYQVANSPIVHKDNSVSKMTVYKDLTDLIKMENKYHQAQKMESVGRLAGGVAHDFNNALSVIIGFTEMALEDTDPKEQLHEDLNEILTAAKRSADITRQLLAFARKQTVAPRVLDLNQNIETILKMLRRLIGEDIDLAWLPGGNLWPVKMDPSQIDQILANLCVNARDAIKGVGRISIESKNVILTRDYCSDHEGFVPGEFVLLSVSDNGCGMKKEILDNIFEPFFTTKDIDRGTGLGLATVYGIAKQNNGFVNANSELDKGTTLKIYLPRHGAEAVEETPGEITGEILQGQGETILVVEDEPSILKLMQKILEDLSYTVLKSSAPEKVMDMVKEHIGEIHLLITDVIMPKMNGRDLAKQLQTDYPSLKYLLMSGYTADVLAHQGVLDNEVNFIQKPFSRKDLAEIVRKVLDEN